MDSGEFTPRRWTAEEYDALIESGVLDEDLRLELLDGVIVEMTPPGDVHIRMANILTYKLTIAMQGRAFVSVQNPLACGENRPQPDLAVMPLNQLYSGSIPQKPLVVIEIADSSIKRDRFKAGIYARAGLPEY